MNAELTKKLFDTYPNLYRGKDLPITQCLMAFGFECNSGWYSIIDELSQKLEAEILKQPEDERSMAMQVKEKYAGLRFYMSCYDTDEMEKFIREAEKKCAVTCEECGNPGECRGEGWFYTRCETCWNELLLHRATFK